MFFDDILIYSHTIEEHVRHLATILGVLNDHQFDANVKKCSFGQQEVAYLGHIISAQGVAVDPEKVQAMVAWPFLKSLKELRGFLRLTGYYRRFILKYAHIAAPLTNQLHKDNFHWNDEAEAAFSALKNAMLVAPVLGTPDFNVHFVVEADASGKGLGAILSHNAHPFGLF